MKPIILKQTDNAARYLQHLQIMQQQLNVMTDLVFIAHEDSLQADNFNEQFKCKLTLNNIELELTFEADLVSGLSVLLTDLIDVYKVDTTE